MRGLGIAVLAPVLALASCSSGPDRSDLAQRRLAELSVEEKAGQLFMSWMLTDGGDREALDRMLGWIEEVGLGGVILSLGPAVDAPELIEILQARSKVPLLVASDFEAGVGYRLYGGTRTGSNMLIGATGDPRWARECGRITAREGLALGVHWAFAPVVDVNVNPRNPIINMRSFGEDPTEVGRMAAAFVEGMESAGMLACAKHYPGHGDVAVDSHVAMPALPGDRDRLERVELAPFRAAIEAGVSSVMTGHLSVPGLGEDPAVPATLSHAITTGELRGRAGFGGIVATDALDMGGLAGRYPPAEAAVLALLAGADLLLMPPDPVAARDAVVEAVRSGRVPMARLDEAVLRLLRAKERVGLLSGGGLPAPDWQTRVATAGHRAIAAQVARRGVTVVRDAEGLIPLPTADRCVLVTVEDTVAGDADRFGGRGERFRDALRGHGRDVSAHHLHSGSEPSEVAAVVAALRAADLAIVDFRFRVRAGGGDLMVPESLQPLVDTLNDHGRAVAVSFGNPYLAVAFPDVSTYVCAYNAGEWTEPAVAAALCGAAPAPGRLPISIPGVAARGAGR